MLTNFYLIVVDGLLLQGLGVFVKLIGLDNAKIGMIQRIFGVRLRG